MLRPKIPAMGGMRILKTLDSLIYEMLDGNKATR
jgi:hypothetical protein